MERMQDEWIKPFLTYGLIGAVRYQGFVPWDDDLDFGLIRNEYENTEFWAPHDMEAVLRYEYIDYMKFPDNVGIMTHEGMKAD